MSTTDLESPPKVHRFICGCGMALVGVFVLENRPELHLFCVRCDRGYCPVGCDFHGPAEWFEADFMRSPAGDGIVLPPVRAATVGKIKRAATQRP